MSEFNQVLARIPFMGGVLASQRFNEDTQQRELQSKVGNLGLLQRIQQQQQYGAVDSILKSDMPAEQKMQALASGRAGALGIQAAQSLAELQQRQAAVSETSRQSKFFSPENIAQFQTLGSPAQPAQFSDTSTQPNLRVAPTAFDPTGGANSTIPVQTAEAKPEVAPGFDMRRFAETGVTQGIKGAEPLLNHMAQREQARNALAQQFMLKQEELRSRERIAAERGADQAELARMRLEGQRELRQMMIAAIQPAAPVAVIGPDGKPVFVNRSDAIGRTPAATDAESQAAIALARGNAKLASGLPQARLRMESIKQNMDRLDDAMTELKDDPGLTNITGTFMGRTPNLSNSATGAQAKLNSIKSQIFQSSLQAMREASKTGGAVGNVSDKEGDKLERTLSALDQSQSTDDFKKELDKAIRQVRLSKEIIKNAFDEQYGGLQQENRPPANAETKAKSSVPAIGLIQNGYRFKGGDPSKQENWEKL